MRIRIVGERPFELDRAAPLDHADRGVHALTVERARHRDVTDHVVALKILRTPAADAQSVQTALRELRGKVRFELDLETAEVLTALDGATTLDQAVQRVARREDSERGREKEY